MGSGNRPTPEFRREAVRLALPEQVRIPPRPSRDAQPVRLSTGPGKAHPGQTQIADDQ